MSTELQKAARNVLQTHLNPTNLSGHTATGVKTINQLLHGLKEQHSPAYETILLETQHVYENAIRIHAQATTNTHANKLEDLIRRLEPVLELPATRKHTRYLLNHSTLAIQKSLSQLHTPIHSFTHIPYSYIQATPETNTDIQQALRAHNLPILQEKHYFAHPITSISHQNNLDLVRAPAAWKYATGQGVKIGVADTGCAYAHAEIQHAFTDVKGVNFVDETTPPLDDNGHGTHVAGTIAGRMVGVAPGATLYALKFLDAHGRGSQTDFIRAAEWSIDNQLDAINASFGSIGRNSAEQAICQALDAHEIALIAAAGNNGTSQYSYPASYDSVISVAAITQNKQHASFSQYNDQVNICAPGVGVRSCIPNGYDSFDGTSMATPHITGAYALVCEHNPNLANKKQAVLAACQELGDAHKFGNGLIQADTLLENTT